MRHVETPQGLCRLGVARCDVTPPIGIYHRMWGAATHERASGVHRPLTATALVLQAHGSPPGPETEQVVIAVDHCLLFAREMDALLGAVSGQTGLAREQLSIAFSHTHGGGLMDLGRVGLPGGDLIPPYLDHLAERLAAIVREARQVVQPATLTSATGRCTLAAHRDFWDEVSGQFVCGLNPEGPADDTVLIARASDREGRIVATVVNYACHPTTLAWENTLISPDYVGAMREVVERETAAPCVFLQGASGERAARGLRRRSGGGGPQRPATRACRPGRPGGTAAAFDALCVSRAGRVGRDAGRVRPCPAGRSGPAEQGPLAGAALGGGVAVSARTANRGTSAGRACALATRGEGGTQQRRYREGGTDCHAQVERQDRWLTRLAMLPPGQTFPLPVALWQVGDGLWLAVEGEHYQVLQRSLRERWPGVPIVVATIVNGSRPAYLPPREAYGKGIYQEGIALLAPGSLEQLIEAVGEEIDAWREAR